ncbi:DNA-binding protein [Acidiferrobacter thiooxydans]|uniref:DNA-binding protein n=1 Tax=Acidiferrobacter thiooxydans TaxID=163359 RepID=UPI0008263537|nr:DNA-binding protein [Acidiferrobacter thiooxydans]UEN98414.1 DNA-binding protein [Acidiferrobacter thiooxydans]
MPGRSSDTRARVREVADRLVADGVSVRDITIDSIYAEIRQGSRTTINDELRAWRRERALFDAQVTAIPGPVLSAAEALWSAASQAAEVALRDRRQEVEDQAVAVRERLQALEGQVASEQTRSAALNAQVAAQEAVIGTLRQDLAAARTAADTARAQAEMLTSQLETQRADGEHRLNQQRADYESRIAALTEAAAEKDVAYRAEIEKAHTRLEGVQNHMLQQVAEARDLAKKAESARALVQQRSDELAVQLQAARVDVAAAKAAGAEREARERQEKERLDAAVQTLQGQIDEARRGEAAARERLAAVGEQIAAQAEQMKVAEREKAGLLDLLAKQSRVGRSGGTTSP